MEFLKKASVRTAAGILAAVLGAASAFMAVSAQFELSDINRESMEVSYIHSIADRRGVKADADIDVLALMYAANTDSSGKIKGNKYFADSLSSAMKEAGVTDKNGKPVIPEVTDYYWQIKSDDNEFSNNSRIFGTSGSSEYLREYYPGYRSDVRSYTNGCGMYYYYTGSGHGYAVYDYDTTGLKSYTDDLGAEIYLNRDGTTPVPFIYNTSEYESFDTEDPMEESGMELKYSVRLNVFPLEEDVKEYEDFRIREEKAESKAVREGMTAIVLISVSVLIMLYVTVMGGYDNAERKFRLRFRDKIPGEIFLAALAGLTLFVVTAVPEIADEFSEITDEYSLSPTAVKSVFTSALTLIYIAVSVSADTLLNRVKCHSVTDTFFITSSAKKIYRKVKYGAASVLSLRDDAFTVKFCIRLGLAVLSVIASLVIAAFTTEVIFLPFVAVIVLIIYIYESFRDLKAINRLGMHITEISSGNYAPVAAEITSVTYGLDEKLNRISDGIQTAVEEQIRSERMKIELVTNVSHDLKTPLTSVISYVDLLSKEELSPAAADYVAVLEQKTARLKTIVSDVFDLAKATANTDVNPERIDAVILMNQVLADMEDKIAAYGREIKTEINAESSFIMAEGKKMYRVLQNLVDNSLKYSMSGTRIFVRLDSENGRMKISVKNTASYEMNFTPDEIAERFTRGDKARTTEGSGLGISIAKSFTEACGGKFEISIDGDVFAVSVEFDETE